MDPSYYQQLFDTSLQSTMSRSDSGYGDEEDSSVLSALMDSAMPDSSSGLSMENQTSYEYSSYGSRYPDYESSFTQDYSAATDYLESQPASGTTPAQDGRTFICLHPSCQQKPFKRAADLERHYKQVHYPKAAAETYTCDYRKCSRGRDAKTRDAQFHRKDHYRDHLRDYHKEDLPKRGIKNSSKGSTVMDKVIKLEWWRCAKCLERIDVRKDGWECPDCRGICDQDRIQARKSLLQNKTAEVEKQCVE
jgi:hypothetical protein